MAALFLPLSLCFSSVPEAWDNYGHDADVDSSLSSSRPGSAPLYRPQKVAFRSVEVANVHIL